MSEVEKLIDRLFNDPNKKVIDFHFTWDPDAAELTVEEKARVLNEFLDAPKRRIDPSELDKFPSL
jgi:hypothetical protein